MERGGWSVPFTKAFCSWRLLFKSKIQNLSNRFKEGEESRSLKHYVTAVVRC